MSRRPAILLTAGLAAALLRPSHQVEAPRPGQPAVQTTGDQESGKPITRLSVAAELHRALVQGLPGAWRLTSFVHAANGSPQVPVVGFMRLGKDGYMTLIIHAFEPDNGFFDDGLRVQAGAHQWRITDNGRLQTSSVIAHSNFSGDLGLEPAYTAREYVITLREDRLILRRSDTSEIYFERMPPGTFPGTTAGRIEEQRAGESDD